jgi:hypothetical protein
MEVGIIFRRRCAQEYFKETWQIDRFILGLFQYSILHGS